MEDSSKSYKVVRFNVIREYLVEVLLTQLTVRFFKNTGNAMISLAPHARRDISVAAFSSPVNVTISFVAFAHTNDITKLYVGVCA